MNKKFKRKALPGLITGILYTAQGASAATLEEVVVTSTKDAQTLQEVPVAVSVVTNEFLAQQNIHNVEGLGTAIPSLIVNKTAFQPTVSIRGFGSGGGTRAFEQSVATYVDGVYAGRANQFLNPFFDVERVEVVRGPQTVLFGVNAIAGGINIVNKKPEEKFGGFVSTGYGIEHETWHVDGAVNIPVTDDLAVRLSGTTGIDGKYMEDVSKGDKKVPEEDVQLLRAIAVWNATDNFSAELSVETSKNETEGTAIQYYHINPGNPFLSAAQAAALGENLKIDDKKTSGPHDPEFTNIDTNNMTLTLDWDLGGGGALTSITGFSKYDFDQQVPAGAVPIDLGTALAHEDYDQLYQELRWTSVGGQTVDYIAGITYLRQNSDIFQGIDVIAVPGLLEAGVRNGLQQDTEAYALFTQLTWNISDSFRTVLGLRYSDVTKNAKYRIGTSAVGAGLKSYVDNPAAYSFFRNIIGIPDWFAWYDDDPANLDPTAKTWKRTHKLEKLDPSLSLQWDITDNMGAYFTFAKGSKAGGFNDQDKQGIVPENGFARDRFEYNDEEATNYEVGLKISDPSYQLNLAVFHTKYDNLQVSQSIGSSIVTDNAGGITSQGIEIDGVYLLTNSVRVGGNVIFLDATYDKFKGVVCPYSEEVALGGSTCDSFGVTGGAVPGNNVDGKNVELASEITGNLFAQWSDNITEGFELTIKGNAYYNDGYTLAADYDPIDRVDSYWMFDLMAQLASTDHWTVTLMGKNLTDEHKLIWGGDAGLGIGHQGVTIPGREYELTVKYDF